MRGRENVSKAIVTEHQNTTGECFSSWERASDAARLIETRCGRSGTAWARFSQSNWPVGCWLPRHTGQVFDSQGRISRTLPRAFSRIRIRLGRLHAIVRELQICDCHRRGQASHRSRALGPLAVTSYKQSHSRPHSKDAPGSSSTSSTNQVMKDHISTPDLPCSLSSRNQLACPLDCLSPSVSISDYSCDAPPRVHSYLRMLGARDMVLGAYAYVLLMQPF
ncbi:uncharacterized protein B0H18DRAFT_1061465 [Fomitopsis serialis]|uniref:uncharacterized protein n=1 Tax=Fomitopsis serialis TaxID=139415 RepID=UPI0020079533|nr:uncharacterized protein B0H18DRAFT_1061465 [Neoantrodia serialis]KAH9911590.1 hypothetical protein B0H18DRAFT_1061465 [Neoantrodia serialis]